VKEVQSDSRIKYVLEKVRWLQEMLVPESECEKNDKGGEFGADC
jgi:hypothetical protein